MKDKSWRDPNFGFPLRNVYPVVCVSWNDGRAFLQVVDEDGARRGPAARGPGIQAAHGSRVGVRVPGRSPEHDLLGGANDLKDGEGRLNISAVDFLPGRNKIWPLANAPWSDGYAFVSPVDFFGEKGRNGFGIADMLGGVWEICLDHFDLEGAHEDAYFVDENPRPVCRGGNYFDVPGNARCAVRLGLRGPAYSDSPGWVPFVFGNGCETSSCWHWHWHWHWHWCGCTERPARKRSGSA